MSASDKNQLTRLDFIKATSAAIGKLISITIGFPTIAHLLSASLRIVEDESVVDLGARDPYPLGIPTLSEFTRTNVYGGERTGLSYEGSFCVRPSRMFAYARTFAPTCLSGHLAC